MDLYPYNLYGHLDTLGPATMQDDSTFYLPMRQLTFFMHIIINRTKFPPTDLMVPRPCAPRLPPEILPQTTHIPATRRSFIRAIQ